MSVEYWFRGALEFGNASAVEAAQRDLKDEGCAGNPDNLIRPEDLLWSGLSLAIDARGSMPYSCLEICSFVLSLYAKHAASGEIVVLNVEDGVGERYMAGGESDELTDEEADALRAEYGWTESG